MKSLFLLSLVPILASAFSLNITVTHLKNTQGQLFIGLYNTSTNFPIQSKIYRGEPIQITSSAINYTVSKLPKGEYAIALFHDENGNGKLDTNFVGMPIESYGFSNNVRNLFSAPSFDEAKFSLDKDMNMTIQMGY